jgi:hypothetical protein
MKLSELQYSVLYSEVFEDIEMNREWYATGNNPIPDSLVLKGETINFDSSEIDLVWNLVLHFVNLADDCVEYDLSGFNVRERNALSALSSRFVTLKKSLHS